jgi:hypothetical protein
VPGGPTVTANESTLPSPAGMSVRTAAQSDGSGRVASSGKRDALSPVTSGSTRSMRVLSSTVRMSWLAKSASMSAAVTGGAGVPSTP